MEKLRFVELANELLKCPLCEFEVDKAERKKAYNHASKKHHGRVSSKLIRSTFSLEEKARKTKVLSYNRVKKFRLLKKLRKSSTGRDNNDCAEANNDDTTEQINDIEIQKDEKSTDDYKKAEEDGTAKSNCNEGYRQWVSTDDVNVNVYHTNLSENTNNIDDILPEVTLLLQMRSDQNMRI